MMGTNSFSRLSRSPWFHLLGSPIVWSAHFLGGYGWVEFACRAGLLVLDSTILGLTVISWVVLFFTLAAFLASLYVGWAAYDGWRRSGQADKTSDVSAWGVEARQFMAFSGMAFSALFSLVILLSGLPVLVLGPCE